MEEKNQEKKQQDAELNKEESEVQGEQAKSEETTQKSATEEVKEELVKKSELDKAVALADDFKRRLYSVTAEYDNYRKRMANTASQKYLDGRADVIEKFFIIGDNLERALAVASDDKMKQGLEMVIKSYEKIIADENIVSYDPKGEPFDPNTANAITALPAENDEKPGNVKMTFAKGYKRGDKILRFAQVAVVKKD